MSLPRKREPLGPRLIRSMEEGLKALRENRPLPTTIIIQPPSAVPFERDRIIRLRQNLKWSQSFMALWLNVSYKTVQSWEQGTRKPSGAALRLLQLFEQPTMMEYLTTKSSRSGEKNKRSRSPIE
jgi:putative transcriptional regulator